MGNDHEAFNLGSDFPSIVSKSERNVLQIGEGGTLHIHWGDGLIFSKINRNQMKLLCFLIPGFGRILGGAKCST